MIVAIDGPAGSGKSSTARAVARALGFRHLDSGALYRALTLAALRSDLPPGQWDQLDEPALESLAVRAEPVGERFRFLSPGVDDESSLRQPAVNDQVSRIARVPAVRAWALDTLRRLAGHHDIVADGRDMGTVVFPDAALKIFMVASPAERARRRLAERGVVDPAPAQVDEEARRLNERDRIDSERSVGPLRRAPDAVDIDTTHIGFEEQVAAIVALARLAGAPAP
ncbi:MAG TPA: (d)CMP kinase [Candidatus Binatia bacterium]|nr:(d)CMP kinase [Candidatus Binatia bacterium]